MNFGNMQGAFMMLPMLWAIVWALVWLYLALRFLRAFERLVGAHERLANATSRDHSTG
jgi:hypothetical protein